MTEGLHIDGAHGADGGQIVRMSVALAALTGRSIRVTHVRLVGIQRTLIAFAWYPDAAP